MYKVIIVDRNGRVSKYMTKTAPIVDDDHIRVFYEERHTLVFVIANLVSYSITDLSKNKEENNAKEQIPV